MRGFLGEATTSLPGEVPDAAKRRPEAVRGARAGSPRPFPVALGTVVALELIGLQGQAGGCSRSLSQHTGYVARAQGGN